MPRAEFQTFPLHLQSVANVGYGLKPSGRYRNVWCASALAVGGALEILQFLLISVKNKRQCTVVMATDSKPEIFFTRPPKPFHLTPLWKYTKLAENKHKVHMQGPAPGGRKSIPIFISISMGPLFLRG